MATTVTTTANETKTTTYTLLMVFTVDQDAHDNLQDQGSIRDEARSWLESLDARVEGVSVRKAQLS